MEFKHIPVLLTETIEYLHIKPSGVYVDGTLGGGGHSKEIAKRLDKEGMLISIDQDIDAILNGRKIFEGNQNVQLVHDNFSNIKSILANLQIQKVDGILLDLGVSSYQLDEGFRGFSYKIDAPLDMRMDDRNPLTAYDVVNFYSEKELTDIIFKYGEERWAKRIVQFIMEKRKTEKIETTLQLVALIKKAIPKSARTEGPHPAKRVFQAVRIEVNGELSRLNKAIWDMADVLQESGRFCVITFHSLEDRIVKTAFKEMMNPCVCPPSFPVCICHKKKEAILVNKKPTTPSKQELCTNPRARSAKLRAIEKILES